MRSIVCGLVIAFLFAGGLAAAMPGTDEGVYGSFKPGSEPAQGFGEYEWGAEIASLEGFTLIECGVFDIPDVCLYRNDNLTDETGGAKVGYLFWRGMFFGAEIAVKGGANWEAMKEIAFEGFGEPPQDGSGNEFVWEGEKAFVFLQYLPRSRVAVMTILSSEIGGEIHERANGIR